ncbi:MAG TPA: VOC family protein, partial [Flavisolibacter sp.]|nr:VOC family protein [Flavisolibacter sp.]
MSITPKTPGIHHIALRCSDMNITKNFYQNILGLPLPLDTPDLLGFAAGSVFIVFKKAAPVHTEDTKFTPYNIG